MKLMFCAKFGQANAKTVAKTFTPNSGLKVVGAETIKNSQAYGTFTPGAGAQEVKIDNSLFADYENGLKGAAEMLDVTIEHEATHYFDDQNGQDFPGEKGSQYETAVHGKVINNRQEASQIIEKN